jgi:hypothetical protein
VLPRRPDNDEQDLIRELKTFAAGWGFTYVKHGTTYIAGHDRLQLEFTAPATISPVGRGSRADGVVYQTLTHNIAVFICFAPSQLERLKSFQTELFNARVTWK